VRPPGCGGQVPRSASLSLPPGWPRIRDKRIRRKQFERPSVSTWTGFGERENGDAILTEDYDLACFENSGTDQLHLDGLTQFS